MRSRVTHAVDPELDDVARRVAVAMGDERQTASRSLLLARSSEALGSQARARATLGELEERLRVSGAWMPPRADRERVEVTKRQRLEGYREPAVSTLAQLRLRPQPLEHALHIASPIVVLALALYFLSSQSWLVPALWIPFAIVQLLLYLRRHEQRERILLEVDDRTLAAGEVKVARDEVRYVSARGRTIEVGLADGRSRTLLEGVAIDDTIALAASLEEELRLLAPRGASATRRDVEALEIERAEAFETTVDRRGDARGERRREARTALRPA